VLAEVGDAVYYALLNCMALRIVGEKCGRGARRLEVRRNRLAVIVTNLATQVLLGDHHPLPALSIRA
jgi:hypothetical protein